jgi:hypothetical protein
MSETRSTPPDQPSEALTPDDAGGIEDLIALAKSSGMYRERPNGRTRTWVLGHEISAIRLDRVGAKHGKGPRHIARDFILDDEIIGLCGEEGSGKSWCAYQIAGELTYPAGSGKRVGAWHL